MSGAALFIGFLIFLMIAARIFLHADPRTPDSPGGDATVGFRDPARPAPEPNAQEEWPDPQGNDRARR